MLGFFVDWKKLYDFMRYEKGCDVVYFYTGIEQGDIETASEFEELSKLPGCIVRSKVIMLYKRRDKHCNFKCIKCREDNAQIIDMGYEKKSNCDVELTVDVIEHATNGEFSEDKEFLIFTGDGRFEFVIRKIISEKVKVKIISSADSKTVGHLIQRRYSKKLKDLVKEKPEFVDFLEIKNWKFKIRKE